MTTYLAQLDMPLSEAIRFPAEQIDTFPLGAAPGRQGRLRHPQRALRVEGGDGVVAAIVPWNYPFEVTSNKIAQALATGNSVVVKPAPDTPWNATRIGRLVNEHTDIPAGIFNVVTPKDNTVAGRRLVDKRVDMVSFTGWTAVGKHIMEQGAPALKRIFLELGGKSAHIVLDDADLETVIPYCSTMCMHAGQGCVLLTRLLVPRSRYVEAVELAANAFRNVTYGDPTDPENVMGPVVNQRQRDRILGYIEAGKAAGARVVFGGGRPEHLPKGWFVEPTLFADVESSMSIAEDEIFGPVLRVLPYDSDDDAVRIVNDSTYGLGAEVTGADLERATRIARKLLVGALGVNGSNWYGADSPYGGYRSSGIGRQNGLGASSSTSRRRPSRAAADAAHTPAPDAPRAPGASPTSTPPCRRRMVARRSAQETPRRERRRHGPRQHRRPPHRNRLTCASGTSRRSTATVRRASFTRPTTTAARGSTAGSSRASRSACPGSTPWPRGRRTSGASTLPACPRCAPARTTSTSASRTWTSTACSPG